jgi:hypothetical protein
MTGQVFVTNALAEIGFLGAGQIASADDSASPCLRTTTTLRTTKTLVGHAGLHHRLGRRDQHRAAGLD